MRRLLVGTAAFLAIGAVMSVWELGGPKAAIEALTSSVPAKQEPRQQRRYGAEHFSSRPVVTQHGERLSFYDDVIRDRIVVVSFIYTACPDICPLTTARLAQLQARLGDAMGREIFFVSITVDPENDTPTVLKEYAEAFGAGPGWLFLTGDPDDIRDIRSRFGDTRDALNEHTQEVRLGNDATAEWQRAALLGDMENLVEAVRAMDPKWRATPRHVPHNPAMDTGYRVPDRPGFITFRQWCAHCHTVGVGDRIGPDLFGVAERRDRDWLTDYIADPVKMRREGDPTALALREAFPQVPMPRLTQLGSGDIRAAIDYLEWETGRIVEMRRQHPIQDHGHDHSSHGHGEAGAEHGHPAHGHGDGADGHDPSARDHGEAGHGHAAGSHGEARKM